MIIRRRSLTVALVLVLLSMDAALAQTSSTTSSSTFNISWSALDPGDDWTWAMLQSVFPVSGTPPTNTGTAATLIGTLLGQITGLVMALAMFFLCYLTIINIHRVSESAQILTSAMTSMAAVRIGFAAIMMFPLSSGFSVGQAGVMQVAGWGIGMARTLYANAVKAIGPDAMVIADPIIPGTRTIVLGLIEDELCRSLINQATATALVPAPTPTVVNSGKGAVVTYAYSLAAGNGTGSPTCGSVSVADSSAAPATLGSVTVDMATQQRSILEGIVSSLRPQIDSIAQSYWQNKTQASLSPLLSLYQTATQSYTQQLTSAAQAITAQLRSNLSSTDARNGNLGLSKNEVQLSTLGWTSAAAYYLGFARLNGLTLSLASGTPTVNMPSFEGLSPSLQADIAPLFTSSSSLLDKLKTYVSTADGLTSPGGNADTLTGTFTGTDGGGMMEKLFRALNFTPTLLQSFVDNLSPTAQNWADPFGGLIALGNQMILVAMTALGLAGIASTTTGTAATTLFNALTMNWAGAVATLSLSVLMQFFATPIFIGCMALLIPGLTIAFVLPMIPWVMWIAGVAGYLILVCEAMVAVPLVDARPSHLRGRRPARARLRRLRASVQHPVPAGLDADRALPRLLHLHLHLMADPDVVRDRGRLCPRRRLARHQLARPVRAPVDIRALACGGGDRVVPHDHADPAPYSAHDRLLVGEPGRHGRVFERRGIDRGKRDAVNRSEGPQPEATHVGWGKRRRTERPKTVRLKQSRAP